MEGKVGMDGVRNRDIEYKVIDKTSLLFCSQLPPEAYSPL